MSEKTKKPAPAAPAAPVALAVLPTAPADGRVVIDPDATRTFVHPVDGETVTITEAERRKTAIRIVEKVGVWALKEAYSRQKGWKG